MYSSSKKKVIEFLEKHPTTDNFEISIFLNISIPEVEEVLEDLEREGRISLTM